MREKLKAGTVINLTSGTNGKGAAKEITIDRVIGTGANAIVYDAHCFDGLQQKRLLRIKECYPYKAKITRYGNVIIFDDEKEKEKAFSAFEKAYRLQSSFQNNEKTGGNTVHLFDLCSGNGTRYSVMDVDFGDTFDSDKFNQLKNPEQLRKILETMLVLTKITAEYHKNGYLHLDIKPNNFLVSYEPSIDIKLFDVDSVIKADDVKSTGLISYSEDWAAPEQIMGYRNKICPATDLYAIGAILFEKLMGRKVCNDDISIFADWEFDKPIFQQVNPKFKRLLKNIFRKTIAANVKRRYQSADELVEALNDAIDVIRDGQPYVISQNSLSGNCFVGRRFELQKIHDAFKKENCHTIFLKGLGGIGKSELAKNYAEKYKNEYDAILFFQYRGSLENDIIREIKIQNCGDTDDIKEKILQKVLNKNILLIVDNFDVENDIYLEQLLCYECDFLFTTRMSADEFFSDNANIQTINVGCLSEKEQISLFEKEYGKPFSDEELDIVKSILTEIEGYTLLIPLLAKQLKSGRYSLRETVDLLCSSGVKGVSDNVIRHNKDGRIKANLYEILRQVLRMSFDNEQDIYILRCMSLLDGIYIKRKRLEALIGDRYADEINELIFQNWINVDGIGMDSVLYLHKVISQVCREEFKPSTENCAAFSQAVLAYVRQNSKSSVLDRVKNHFFELIIKNLSGNDELMMEFYLEYIKRISFNPECFNSIVGFYKDRENEKNLKMLINVYSLKIKHDGFIDENDERIWEDVDTVFNECVERTMITINKVWNYIKKLETYNISAACEEYYNFGELLLYKINDVFYASFDVPPGDKIFLKVIECFDNTDKLLAATDFPNNKKIEMYQTMGNFYGEMDITLDKPDFCYQPERAKRFSELVTELQEKGKSEGIECVIANGVTIDFSNNDLANKKLQEGNYDAAIELYKKSVAENDTDVDAYTGMAICYYLIGNNIKAEETLNTAEMNLSKYTWEDVNYEINLHIQIAEGLSNINLPLKALEQYKRIWDTYSENEIDMSLGTIAGASFAVCHSIGCHSIGCHSFETRFLRHFQKMKDGLKTEMLRQEREKDNAKLANMNRDTNDDIRMALIKTAISIHILSQNKKEKQTFYCYADYLYKQLSNDCKYVPSMVVFVREKLRVLNKNGDCDKAADFLSDTATRFTYYDDDRLKVLSDGLGDLENKIDDIKWYETGINILSRIDSAYWYETYTKFIILFFQKAVDKSLYLKTEIKDFINNFVSTFDKYMDTTDEQKKEITILAEKLLSIFEPRDDYGKYLEACIYKILADNYPYGSIEIKDAKRKCNYYIIADYKTKGKNFSEKYELWNNAINGYLDIDLELFPKARKCFSRLFKEWDACINSGDYNSSFNNYLYSLTNYHGYIECLVKSDKSDCARDILNDVCLKCGKLIKNDPNHNIYETSYYFEQLAHGMEFLQDNENTIFMYCMALISEIDGDAVFKNYKIQDIDDSKIENCEAILHEALEKTVDEKNQDRFNEFCSKITEIANDKDEYANILQLCKQISNKNIYDDYRFKNT